MIFTTKKTKSPQFGGIWAYLNQILQDFPDVTLIQTPYFMKKKISNFSEKKRGQWGEIKVGI